MAIITEHPFNGREDLIRHSSDAGYTIMQTDTGIEYGEAIDRYPTAHTYTETDHPIETEEEETEDERY